MSNKEEKLRRAVLSRESAPRISKNVAGVLATAGVLAMGAGSLRPMRVDYNAERGRFSSGDFHPDKCSCSKCAAWRRAERYR